MRMSGWTRRPAFWIAYALFALAAAFTAWRLFPLAIPLLNLDIKLARHDAVAVAKAHAAKLDLAPEASRSAVRFAHDDTTQNYVELEGGGKRAFAALMEGTVYAPYWWEVRLFVPGEIGEALIRFRPDGTPYGFEHKIPEAFVPADPALLALAPEAARHIAEDRAHADWGVDFSHYRPLEQTQQRRPTGRVDHLFVYERTDAQAGEARFRMRLAVAGNLPTELTHFTFVPQSFERRYLELRSANNTIAAVASLAAGVLYGLGGCVLGVLWLMRKHWLVWRPALVAGLVVGGLMGATTLSGTPMAWFGYDTAEPVTSFWVRQIGSAVLVVFGGGLAYALVFMAAESLSRRAFPGHPQLWHVWNRDVAATPQILGRTLGGYLFVGLELALVALFYYATNRWLGWWQPSEALTDPNILGSAIPALAPIAISLQAGFMEECVFRAVPLSLAALIGARFGHRGLAVGIAAVVQALIFGGAHANYPGFPAYSRLVELFLPSLLWALLFLRFGLLTTILLHALFDLTLFAIPLFLVDAPGAFGQRALVIAAGLVPLAVVLAQRFRAGAWTELAQGSRNGGWRLATAVPVPPERVPPESAMPVARWIVAFHRALPALGAAGLALWLWTGDFRADVPPLPLSRAEAIAVAEEALRARGVVLPPVWHRFARVRLASQESQQWDGHTFVWREAGRDAYARLIGNVLAPPLWEVRFARFTGDIAERAEEWRITIDGTRRVRQVRHVLPEGRSGPSLEKDAALAIAERAVREQLPRDPSTLRLIGAEQNQQPARRDWAFLFSDPAAVTGPGGDARVQVVIAGDEVASAGRYVFIPESWQRTEHERESRMSFAKFALAGFAGVAAVAALIVAVTQWMRRRYDRQTFVAITLISFLLATMTLANNWPKLAMNLRTSEPILTQAGLTIAGGVFGSLFAALAIGLVSAIGARAAMQRPPHVLAGRWPAWVGGACAGLLVAGLGSGLAALAPQTAPMWPSYALAGQAVPLLGAAVAGAGALSAIGAALFILAWLNLLTQGWRRHLWLAGVVLVLVLTGIAVIDAANPVAAIAGGLIAGAAAALIVYGLLRFDLRTVPAYVASELVLGFAESGARNATSESYVYAAVAITVTIAVAAGATHYLTVRARVMQAAEP